MEKFENRTEISKSYEGSEDMNEFYYFESLVNEYGAGYGQLRHRVHGKTREEAVGNLEKYLQSQLESGEIVFGSEWAIDIRGKTPKEAAEIRITTDDGSSDDDDRTPWGSRSDVWSQENHGHDIGVEEKVEAEAEKKS